MSVLDVITFTFQPGLGDAIDGHVHRGLESRPAGRLLGIWRSEISVQNVVKVLRAFDDLPELMAARARVQLEEDPFGCGEVLVDLSFEACAPFAGFERIEPAPIGPYYEFRSYRIPPGGIGPTLEAWSEMVPRRQRVSPAAAIFYALDGSPRFTHVWAYPSLAERESLRARALAEGVWPPRSAPRWLTADMRSEIYLPTAQSPFQ